MVDSHWFDLVQFAPAPSHEPYELPDGRFVDGYSVQWWLPFGYDQEFIARGAGQQYMYVNKRKDYVVAQFSGLGAVSTKEEITFYRAIGDHLESH